MNIMSLPKHVLSVLAVLAVSTFTVHATTASSSGDSGEKQYVSVNHIQGIGKYKFGELLKDIPPASIQPISPKAKGVLLRVTPYGDNYLVKDLTGLTWGGIPISGLILTFHDGSLIDFQLALKGKKGDFYVADRAFKDKYGPSDARSFPVECWRGDDIEVSLVLIGASITDPNSLDQSAQAKVELFDAAQWHKYEVEQKAKLQAILDKQYEAVSHKVKTDL